MHTAELSELFTQTFEIGLVWLTCAHQALTNPHLFHAFVFRFLLLWLQPWSSPFHWVDVCTKLWFSQNVVRFLGCSVFVFFFPFVQSKTLIIIRTVTLKPQNQLHRCDHLFRLLTYCCVRRCVVPWIIFHFDCITSQEFQVFFFSFRTLLHLSMDFFFSF